MSADEPEPTIAQEAGNGTTTLTVAADEPAMTVPLSQRLASVQYWTTRRDLHSADTKAYKALDEKVKKMDGVFQFELAAHRGRQLLEPQRRLEMSKKRKATLLKKRADSIGRVVKAIKGLGSAVKDDDALAVAVADALEPPAEPQKKKAKKARKVTEEEEDDDE